MSNWQIEQLRFTTFPKEITDVNLEQLWGDIFGSQPDNIQYKPQQGKKIIQGVQSLGMFILEINPSRVHIRLVPDLDSQIPLGNIPSVGLLEDILPSFRDLIFQWFSAAGDSEVARLAFGAILFQIVSNKNEGYGNLDRYLKKVEIDPHGSSDFLYQINRPRKSIQDIKNLDINRLSKWSYIQFQSGMLNIDQKEFLRIQHEPINAIRLELDINTSEHFKGMLPTTLHKGIFEELISLGVEISDKGDIP